MLLVLSNMHILSKLLEAIYRSISDILLQNWSLVCDIQRRLGILPRFWGGITTRSRRLDRTRTDRSRSIEKNGITTLKF